ncbi:alpha-2 adrenergic receptor [Trichonephila clavipes]|nr:alpha-2 adrenergic receptor [Trichonephila clavipes]
MKIGNNGNLVLDPFDESTPCLVIVLMNCQTKLRINHLTAVKSVAILESSRQLHKKKLLIEIYSRQVCQTAAILQLSQCCYTRALGEGPRNFEPWSSNVDDTGAGTPSPNYHTNGRTFQLSTDLTCIAALQDRSLVWYWARTYDMPTMIRYLDHWAIAAPNKLQNVDE